MARDPYEILQVARHADPEVINAAYRRLARKYHPDLNPGPDAGARMQDLNWAYEVLRDPLRRASIDRELRRREQQKAYSYTSASSHWGASSGSGGPAQSAPPPPGGTRGAAGAPKAEPGPKRTSPGETSSTARAGQKRSRPWAWFGGAFLLYALARMFFGGSSTDQAPSPTTVASDISPRASPTTRAPTAKPPTAAPSLTREDELRLFLIGIVEDPRYDYSSQVVHKYLDQIDVDISLSTLAYTVWGDLDTADDFINLGADLIVMGAIVSRAGQSGDWNLARIEVTNPGPYDSYAMLYVTGATSIRGIASGEMSIYDVMLSEVDYGFAPTPAPTRAISVEPTRANCHPSYPTVCIPPAPPDLDCADIPFRRFPVVGEDPHGFDGDYDGVGCESG